MSIFQNDYIRLIQFLQHDITIILKNNTIKEKNVDKLISLIEKIAPNPHEVYPLIVPIYLIFLLMFMVGIFMKKTLEKTNLKKMYTIFKKNFELTQDEIELWDKEINT